MILPDIILHSRVNRRWTESGLDSLAQCANKQHFHNFSQQHDVNYVYNSRGFRDDEWPTTIKELKKCILVCRNCHAELHHPNYKKENIDLSFADRHLNEDRFEPHRYKIKSSGKCPVCDSEVYGTKYCSTNCAQMAMRKVVRPTKKELKKDIKEMSWSAIGRKYGVSDNAVRKWARKYDIPTKTHISRFTNHRKSPTMNT